MEVYVRYRPVPNRTNSNNGNAAAWVFTAGSLMAMLLYPGYNLAGDYLSRLGTHQRSALVFNSTVVVTALLLVPTYTAMFYGLSAHMTRKGIVLLNLGIAAGLLSATYLALVGVFPDTVEKRPTHRQAAVTFFILTAVSLSFLTLAVLSSKGPTKSLPLSFQGDYLGFAFLLLVYLMIDFGTWYHRILQKVFVYGSLVFLGYLTTRIERLSSDKEFFYHSEKFDKPEVFSLDQAMVNSRTIF